MATVDTRLEIGTLSFFGFKIVTELRRFGFEISAIDDIELVDGRVRVLLNMLLLLPFCKSSTSIPVAYGRENGATTARFAIDFFCLFCFDRAKL